MIILIRIKSWKIKQSKDPIEKIYLLRRLYTDTDPLRTPLYSQVPPPSPSPTMSRPMRPSAMTEAQKKELYKKRIDEKYKEFEATIERRTMRLVDQQLYIKEKERSIQGFERMLREKHSEKTFAFIREELRVAQKKMSEMKKNLSGTQKALDLAYNEQQRFLEKTFGPPRRGESCVAFGEIRTVLQYGKYHFVEIKKYKY